MQKQRRRNTKGEVRSASLALALRWAARVLPLAEGGAAQAHFLPPAGMGAAGGARGAGSCCLPPLGRVDVRVRVNRVDTHLPSLRQFVFVDALGLILESGWSVPARLSRRYVDVVRLARVGVDGLRPRGAHRRPNNTIVSARKAKKQKELRCLIRYRHGCDSAMPDEDEHTFHNNHATLTGGALIRRGR